MSESRITKGGIEELVDESEVKRLGFAEIEYNNNNNFNLYVDGLKSTLPLKPNTMTGPMTSRLRSGLESKNLYLAYAEMEHDTYIEDGIRKTKKYITGDLYQEK